MQDESLQIQINLSQNKSSKDAVQLQSWVNTAMDAKINGGQESSNQSGQKIQLNMTFSQSILNRRS